MKRLTFTILLFLGASDMLYAQYDVHFTHFAEMENFYNPAAMNRDSRLNAMASYSMQMAGYEGAPTSLYAGASMALPFNHMRHSMSFSLFNENIGLFASQRMAFDYAFKITMGRGWLNIGIQGGIMSQSFDGSKVRARDGNDPAFPSGNEKGTGADMGAGIFYVRDGLSLGASVQHLNSPHIEFGKPNQATTYMDICPAYYIQGQYNIKTRNPLLLVQPCFMLASDMQSFRADIRTTVSYRYEKFLMYAGAGWSPEISCTALLGATVGEMTIGYAYEIFTGGAGAANGSHDLLVNWKKEVDLFSHGRNSHKSVRYL
ncbi:MAG: PorP/SprF family type IX secretion system membrane protein [Bacteroidaceae bacterium]|nr:PorP/SprF family type IX secretion system membrane protein [Bacteroidaceae bacterium]